MNTTEKQHPCPECGTTCTVNGIGQYSPVDISHLISDQLQNILSSANVLEGERTTDHKEVIQEIKKSVKEIREILDKH